MFHPFLFLDSFAVNKVSVVLEGSNQARNELGVNKINVNYSQLIKNNLSYEPPTRRLRGPNSSDANYWHKVGFKVFLQRLAYIVPSKVHVGALELIDGYNHQVMHM